MARWDHEKITWVQPDQKRVQCTKCMLRKKDRPDGATLGICDVFDFKPPEILFDGADCPYFIDEDTPDDDE